MPSEDLKRQSGSSDSCPNLANSDVFCSNLDYAHRQSSTTSKEGQPPDSTSFISTASSERQGPVDGLSCIREAMAAKGIPDEAKPIILKSWRDGTQKQYNVYLKKWIQFCGERKISKTEVTVNSALMFLTNLYVSGLKYSAINTARCALSSLNFDSRITIGNHPIIVRFMKGVYESRPIQSKYSSVWDVKKVLNMFREWKTNKELSLKDLTLKTVMLISLVSAQRVQSIHMLDTANMIELEDTITFQMGLLKQSRPTAKSMFLEFHKYPEDENLCVVRTLTCYLRRTSCLRGQDTKVFITYSKPHHAASKDTIRRWIKTCLTKAKIDTAVFTAHSTRAASTSAAQKGGLPLQLILEKAGWSNETTFARHYNVPVEGTKALQFTKAVFS